MVFPANTDTYVVRHPQQVDGVVYRLTVLHMHFLLPCPTEEQALGHIRHFIGALIRRRGDSQFHTRLFQCGYTGDKCIGKPCRTAVAPGKDGIIAAGQGQPVMVTVSESGFGRQVTAVKQALTVKDIKLHPVDLTGKIVSIALVVPVVRQGDIHVALLEAILAIVMYTAAQAETSGKQQDTEQISCWYSHNVPSHFSVYSFFVEVYSIRHSTRRSWG